MKPFTVLSDTSSDLIAIPVKDEIVSGLARSILESSSDCIKLIDLDGRLLYMNRNGMCAMEIDDFCDVENEPWPALWPAEAKGLLESALEDAALGKRQEFEAYCPTARGAPRWWRVSVAPVRDPDGKIVNILASSRDVTERVQHENALHERDLQLQSYAETLTAELMAKEALIVQQRVLAAEIDHRVKNSFALIGSILRMKMRTMNDGDAREALSDAANRISTLSRVHEQLHTDVEAQDVAMVPFLKKLTKDLSETLTDTSTVSLGDTVELSVTSDVAVAIGLVTSELVSNALKHRQVDEPIHVSISLIQDLGDGSMILRVADTGEGLPGDFDLDSCSGLGMQICKTYSRTLNGRFSVDRSYTGGAAFVLAFPNVLATKRR